MDGGAKSSNNQGDAPAKQPQEKSGGNPKKKRRRGRGVNKQRKEAERRLEEKERSLRERELNLEERERFIQERERCLLERESCLLPTAVTETSGCQRVAQEGGRVDTLGVHGLADPVGERLDRPQDVDSTVPLSAAPGQTAPLSGQTMPLLGQTALLPGQDLSPTHQAVPPMDQTVSLLDQTMPPPDQTTPIQGQSVPSNPDMAPAGQTIPALDQTIELCSQDMAAPSQITPAPGSTVGEPGTLPPTGQSNEPLDSTLFSPGQSSLSTPYLNQCDVSHTSTSTDQQPCNQTHSIGQVPTNQCVESAGNLGPLANPGPGMRESEETVNTASSPVGESSGDSTPGRGPTEPAEHAGNESGDRCSERRKDTENSQQSAMEMEQKEGMMGQMTSEGSGQPSQEPEHAKPGEKQHGAQEVQESDANPRGEDSGKGEKRRSSSAPPGSPVDPPSSEQTNDEANQNDDEGFQTVTSKRKRKKQAGPAPQISQNLQQVPTPDAVTVYFHAILSKDFGLDPNCDTVFMVPGPPLGDWNFTNAVKMEVTKDLGGHGFLVQGRLLTSREIADFPIPYKYALLKGNKPQFEYIYKFDAVGLANRCLCVMNPLLTQQGEWHQYDDIICAQSDRGMMTRLRSWFGRNEEKAIASGRHLAGKVMLDTIFDLLRSWSAVNVTNFFAQLHQFFVVYCHPVVFESSGPKVWQSLGFGQAEVNVLLREFLMENIVPLLREGGGRKETFLRDPLKAGLVTLMVWVQYLRLDNTEHLSYMCDLLCLPPKPREEFDVYWRDLSSGFQEPNCRREVVKRLELFCTMALKERVVRWILVLPLLHFLRGDCRPYERLPASFPSIGSGFQVWAGLREVSVSDLQPNLAYTRALVKEMAAHKHLVQMDRLLARSWLYVLAVEGLTEFCSAVPVDLYEVLLRLSHGPLVQTSNEATLKVLVYLCNSIKEEKFSCYDASYGKKCLTVSLKLLEKICQATKDGRLHKLPVTCVELVSAVAEFAAGVPEEQLDEAQAHLACHVGEEIGEALPLIRDWMRNTFDGALLRSDTWSTTFAIRQEMEAWNSVLSLTFGGEEFSQRWRTALLNDFEGKLKQERNIEQIEIYCNKTEEVRKKFSVLSACFEKCALDAVSTVCQDRTERTLFERLKNHDLRKFGNLLSALVLKAWPCGPAGEHLEGEGPILEHLLTWPAAKNIFQLQGADGKLIEQLSDTAGERMAVATSVFRAVLDQFLRGNIRMKNLKLILKHKGSFLELLDIDALSVSGRCRNSVAMKRLMKFREDEVNSVLHERALLSNLLEVCQKLHEHIAVDVKDLEMKLGLSVEEMALDEFMEVHQPEGVSSVQAGLVTFFDLPQGLREMAGALYKFRSSIVFGKCWESRAKALSHGDDAIMGEMEAAHIDDVMDESGGPTVTSVSLGHLHDKVFQPCYRRYREIYDSLRSGGLTLQEVDDIFEIYKGNYDMLTDDLQTMNRIEPSEDSRWIHQRVQQIEQYHELHLALESAKVIMEVKQTLCPQGDFHILDTLLGVSDAEFKRETLDCIDNNLIKVKKEAAMTEEQRLCLEEICLRRSFIMWLKEALQDLNELKVFVDLASISAGENDLDVDRVACFHDAVLGYSSVLYELKPDSGFRPFKRALGKLWKALGNDSNLPKKLRDTARHLEWLKTVKDSHGSVELSSLSLASAINKKGLYVIRAQNQKKLTLDTILKLEIMEEEREEAQLQEVVGVRSYCLDDLKELLNKLMLMSGRGEPGQKGEVDCFSEVFSSVQRMALVFIDLHAAGNPLFQHWEAKITCRQDSKASIAMDFHLGCGISTGEIAVEGDLLDQLPELCRKMEQYLSTWKDFMNKQRSTHYYLNYYTAEQVVFLCDQLSPRTQNPVLHNQVVTMLSFIRPGGEAQGLREALCAFWEIITTKKAHRRSNGMRFILKHFWRKRKWSSWRK
ncbi:hypothetical protein GJAV_G00142200 [Gymnothorax javanicus]|nr:hypothetical protein GJAV_G00142200 [Gymnothorax javanicus]